MSPAPLRVPPRARLVCVLLATSWSFLGGSKPATADTAPATPAVDDEARSREAYERGQRHYDLGEFVEAERWFREAYRIVPVPGLLFDVAQALRRQGRCRDALDAYRTFLRLAAQGDPMDVARGHVAELEASCGDRAPAPAAAPHVPASQPAAPEPAHAFLAPTSAVGLHRRSPWPPVVAGGGLAVAAAGATLLVWAHGQHDAWAATDRMLRDARPQDAAQATMFAAEQNDNDALRRRIDRAQTASVVALAVGGALVIGGVVWWLAQR